MDEKLFNQKYTFKPTVYSERPPENPYLPTMETEYPQGSNYQPPQALTSTEVLAKISDYSSVPESKHVRGQSSGSLMGTT